MTTTRRLSLAYLALMAGVAVLFALNLFWGSVSLTPGAVAAALLGRGEDALAVGIVLQLRLPRAVMVVLLGAALSAAGYLLQTFFANPIAGPFVMGVSSGAKLAVALTMVVFLLYYYEDYSIQEISEMIQRNPSTIQTQLERARKKLKMQLEQKGGFHYGQTAIQACHGTNSDV